MHGFEGSANGSMALGVITHEKGVGLGFSLSAGPSGPSSRPLVAEVSADPFYIKNICF